MDTSLAHNASLKPHCGEWWRHEWGRRFDVQVETSRGPVVESRSNCVKCGASREDVMRGKKLGSCCQSCGHVFLDGEKYLLVLNYGQMYSKERRYCTPRCVSDDGGMEA